MADVKILAPFILKWEGGYVNHPNDPGGPTNMGVTLNTWKAYGYDKTGDKKIDASDIKKLNAEDFTYVLKVGYWNRWKGDSITNQAIANVLVDWVWGSGAWGIKIPQRLLGIKEDGIVGYVTVNALNKAIKEDKIGFITKLYKARYDYINSIIRSNSKLAVFKTGWLNRMKDLEKFNQKYL